MKTIFIPGVTDGWDPVKKEFIQTKDTTITIEHSLISISKWESIWQKPFLTQDQKTYEEIISYYKCMTLTQNVDPDVYRTIKKDVAEEITAYINNPMTATTVTHRKKGGSKDILTSEVIYWMMAANQIPFTCEKWHLNRLLMLLEVCSIKNAPKDKMSKKETLAQHRALNAARRAKYHTNG